MRANLEIKPAIPDDARVIAAVLSEVFAEYKQLYTAAAYAATTPNSDVIKRRFAEGVGCYDWQENRRDGVRCSSRRIFIYLQYGGSS